jgi:hypothetical protein
LRFPISPSLFLSPNLSIFFSLSLSTSTLTHNAELTDGTLRIWAIYRVNVKMHQCRTWRHTGGKGITPLVYTLDTRCRLVVMGMAQLLYLHYPLNGRLYRFHSRSGCFAGENSSALARNQTTLPWLSNM